MTGEEEFDGDRWRRAVLDQLHDATPLLNRIESRVPYVIEPKSDLAGDRETVRDLWVDTKALQLLKTAVDHLAGLRSLVLSGDILYAPFPLLRAALESSATAVWLLEPDDRSIRLQRMIGFHVEDTNNKKSVQSMLPENLRDTFDHEPGIRRMVRDSGSQRKKCKFPNYSSLLRAVDDMPDTGGSLLLSWRVSSGVSHSLGWATLGLMTQSNREQIGPTLHRVDLSPNFALVSANSGVAIRTIERAHCLFEIRRTARPHDKRLSLTRNRQISVGT